MLRDGKYVLLKTFELLLMFKYFLVIQRQANTSSMESQYFLFLTFCSFLFPSRGEKIERLSFLTEEYNDTNIIIVTFSPDTTLDPFIRVPLIILQLPDRATIHKAIRTEKFNPRTKYALFLLFPEKKYPSIDALLLSSSMSPFLLEFPMLSQAMVFINVFANMDNSFDIAGKVASGSGRGGLLNTFIHVLSIFKVKRKEIGGPTPTYSVTSLLVGLKTLRGTQLHFLEYPACTSLDGSNCRSVVEKCMSPYWYGGKLVIEDFNPDGGEVPLSSYIEPNATNLYKMSKVVGDYFKSPFEKNTPYSQYLFTPTVIMEYFAYGGLDLWIVFDGPYAPLDPKVYHAFTQGTFFKTATGTQYSTNVKELWNRNPYDHFFILPTGDSFMNFVTCDGVLTSTAFRFYVNPYDTFSWISIAVVTFLFLPTSVLILFKLRSMVPTSGAQLLNLFAETLFFNISLALEISPNIPAILAKLERGFEAITRMLGLWALLSIILVNAYKGIVTTELTANSPETQKYTKINETDGFIFILPETALTKFSDRKNYFKVRILMNSYYDLLEVDNLKTCLCYPDLEEIVPQICSRAPYTACFTRCAKQESCLEVNNKLKSTGLARYSPKSGFCRYSGQTHVDALFNYYRWSKALPPALETSGYRYSCGVSWAIRPKQYYQSIIQTGTAILPFKEVVLSEAPHYGPYEPKEPYYEEIIRLTSDCDRIGYIDYEEDLDSLIGWMKAESEKMSMGDVMLMKGKEKLFHWWEGVGLSYDGSIAHSIASRIYTRVLDLMAHGIFQIWNDWDKILRPNGAQRTLKALRKRERFQPKPLSFKSNIKTIFIIYVVSITITIMLFSLEARRSISNGIGNTLQMFKQELLQLGNRIELSFQN